MKDDEPIWIDEASVLAIHGRLLVIHGGASGIRDEGLLKSALARPENLAHYGTNIDIIDLATAYTAGIVKNHPFIDGNKRAGFVVGILFLELNGYIFSAPEDAAANAVLGVASGTLNDSEFAAFLRENAIPSD
jgi:death-on-curing protein